MDPHASQQGSEVLANSRLAFIGAGVMAEAMIRGVLAHHLVSPNAITASHPREVRRHELHSRFGVHTSEENRLAAAAADIVVLTVKPQILPSVLAEIRGSLAPQACLVSVVAGARIRTIVEGTLHRAVIRCMPNTPAQVGEGITVWTATAEVNFQQRSQARAILRALGTDLPVEKEEYLDMATAVSGTGPAYVFLLMEALIDAAVHLGFSRADARQLVLQTIRGAAEFAAQAQLHPAELRNMVTSPGGTSAAALYQLEKGSFRTVLSKAVWAAYQRSMALGQISQPVESNGGEAPTGIKDPLLVQDTR